jgi:hypothetical protein
MARFNPFRPGSIVTPGMFSGRVEEVVALEKILYQTKNGNPHHFLLHGERGIGKSSLLFYLQCVARGEIESLQHGLFKFLTVHIELEPSNTYTDIIRKVGTELHRTVASHQRARELAKTVWEFISCWQVAGVKFTKDEKRPQPHELLEDLTHTIERTLASFGEEFDGILILVDEADKPSVKANLGEFIKVFTERLAKRGCGKISLGIAGLSGVIEKLRESHESSPRIFEIFTLNPLKPAEIKEVIQKGLTQANDKNGFAVTASDAAINLISEFSEGYPHFIQQFAHSAFDADTDNAIDQKDVLAGSLKKNGAFQQLGLKYYEELYFDQIGSDEYREVLRVMSDKLDEWVSKKDIRKAISIKESTLDNAIAALKHRRIIIAKPGVKGSYRLPTKSFAIWIGAYTKAAEKATTEEKVSVEQGNQAKPAS